MGSLYLELNEGYCGPKHKEPIVGCASDVSMCYIFVAFVAFLCVCVFHLFMYVSVVHVYISAGVTGRTHTGDNEVRPCEALDWREVVCFVLVQAVD